MKQKSWAEEGRASGLDVALCLALAAAIHGNDRGVAATAKRLSKLLGRADRHLMFTVMDSPSPLKFVRNYLRNLPAELFPIDAEEPVEAEAEAEAEA